MPIMTWDSSLDIGVDKMNDDHKEILDCMNRIYDAHRAGQTGTVITMLVSQLGQICARHFAIEERYMKSIGFPGFEDHKTLHNKLLAKFSEHAAVIRGAGGVCNDAFFGFLKFWLASHIKGIDIQYARHAKAVAKAS
jgi:hemerythrin